MLTDTEARAPASQTSPHGSATPRFVLGAGVVVRREDDAILIGKRLTERGWIWSLPGGKVDTGETVEACSLRELREETALTQVDLPRAFCVVLDTRQCLVTIGVEVLFRGGEPRVVEPHAFSEWRWWAGDEWREPLFGPSREVLRQYQQFSSSGCTRFLDYAPDALGSYPIALPEVRTSRDSRNG